MRPVSRTTPSTSLIVSPFVDRRGPDYIMLTNNSLRHSAWALCRVRCRKAAIVRIGWLGQEQTVATNDGSKEDATLNHWLAPGQMELFRVDEGSPER